MSKVEWATDNSLILSGGEDGIIRIWKVEGMKTISLSMELGQHHMQITGLAISEDKSRVFSCAKDKTIRVYDMEKKKHIRSLTFAHSINAANMRYMGIQV